jgi:peptide/nickel transport system ATP-binding protein
MPVASLRDVGLAYVQHKQRTDVLHHVSFDIRAGEIVGLVGESGCGKSSLALLMMGYRHPAARVRSGTIHFYDQDILGLPDRELVNLRGNRIGFVPQNPTTSLNPGMRVGVQVAESLRAHGLARSHADALPRVLELFGEVGLTDPEAVGHRYPHQLSGGQQQRVIIAMALACGPDLVILDEPTTGLDVTTQEQIIELLKGLRDRLGTAMLYVTHDLGVLAELADRICVMYAGYLVESAPTEALFTHPRHPYTRGLIGSIPRLDGRRAKEGLLTGHLDRREMSAGCPFQPRCSLADEACIHEAQNFAEVSANHHVACRNWREVRSLEFDDELPTVTRNTNHQENLLQVSGLSLRYGGRSILARLAGQPAAPLVVEDVSFSIGVGEVLALVGESGSGKSTIAKAISGLLRPVDGEIVYRGRQIDNQELETREHDIVQKIQFVFQNPDASLNPRQSVGRSIARPIEVFFTKSGAERDAMVVKMLDEVMLTPDYARRYPDQMSGGERQRVAIARGLAAAPDLLLCDEVLSALDVSVQASVLDLMERLRSETSVAMLFISHDLAVVRRLADRVCVLYHGQIMESGPVDALFGPPFHPYTFSLLISVPGSSYCASLPHVSAQTDRIPAPGGCAFAGRCTWRPDDRCFTEPPPLHTAESGLEIRCHLSAAELHSMGERGASSWHSTDEKAHTGEES